MSVPRWVAFGGAWIYLILSLVASLGDDSGASVTLGLSSVAVALMFVGLSIKDMR